MQTKVCFKRFILHDKAYRNFLLTKIFLSTNSMLWKQCSRHLPFHVRCTNINKPITHMEATHMLAWIILGYYSTDKLSCEELLIRQSAETSQKQGSQGINDLRVLLLLIKYTFLLISGGLFMSKSTPQISVVYLLWTKLFEVKLFSSPLKHPAFWHKIWCPMTMDFTKPQWLRYLRNLCDG